MEGCWKPEYGVVGILWVYLEAGEFAEGSWCIICIISNLQWHRGLPFPPQLRYHSMAIWVWVSSLRGEFAGLRLEKTAFIVYATAQKYTVISFWILGGTSCLVWHSLMTCHWLRRNLDEPNMLTRPCTARISVTYCLLFVVGGLKVELFCYLFGYLFSHLCQNCRQIANKWRISGKISDK